MKPVVCVNGHVERAQYEAELAQRRYLKVDPDNHLVASVEDGGMECKTARSGGSTNY